MSSQSTKDYGVFKKSEFNRDIDKTNLKNIICSIQTRNLLQFRPIMVNDKMEVIDGQHRLEAAKALAVAIYYTKQKDSAPEDVHLLNDNLKRWTLADYLNYHCAHGKTHYLDFRRFCDERNISVSLGAVFILGFRGNGFHRKFRSGLLIYPHEQSNDINEQYTQYTTIKKFIDERTMGSKTYLKATKFVATLNSFLKREDVNFEKFMGRIEVRLNLFRSCVSHRDYTEMLTQIYNYRNHTPIQ